MDDNDLFMVLSQARENKKPQRTKGYYICADCGEFIRAIARRTAKCPFCAKDVERVLCIDSVMETTIHAIWRDSGLFNLIRADGLRKEHTEILVD